MSESIVPNEAKVVQGRIEDPDRLARIHGWTCSAGPAGSWRCRPCRIVVLDLVAMRGSAGNWRMAAANRLVGGLQMPALGQFSLLAATAWKYA